MSIDGLKTLQEVEPGRFPFVPSVDDFDHVAMSDWNYDACFEPHPFDDWDYHVRWLNYGESYEQGPGYGYRYWEAYWTSQIHWSNDPDFSQGRYVVCIWHYANAYPSDWTAEIVCVNSTIDFGPDPWAQGRLSERQPGALVYREEVVHHQKWGRGNGSASLGEIPGTYSFEADQAAWQQALGSTNNLGEARFSTTLGPHRCFWYSGAIRNFTEGIDEAISQYRASGQAYRGSVSNVRHPFSSPPGVYGEDWSEFPGTWLYPTWGRWMFDGMPVVVAAGLKFGILMYDTWYSHGYMPDTGTARLEFEPSNYDLVVASSPSESVVSEPGGGAFIDFVFNHQTNELISHSGTLDYTIRSAEKDPQYSHIYFDIEFPYMRDALQATIGSGNPGLRYENVIFKHHNYIDPEYSWTGMPPPFGGFGTSGISELWHQLTWRNQGDVRLWYELQWPDYYWWIPSVECPPHLRLLQRSDVAKGPFEPIPATPDCGYALRLAGRDVQQNLIPGNLPRVQPNSYP